MSKITCPDCGEFNDTDGKFGEEEKLDYWMGDDGVFHWTCLECGHEWDGDHEGTSYTVQNASEEDEE
jgi:hypothetical protein